MNRLVELGTEFRKAIDTWDDGIVVRRDDLAGMPDRWIDGLKTVEEDGETKYRVSLDYPEIMPVHGQRRIGRVAPRAVHQEPDQGRRGRTSRVLEEAIARPHARSPRCWATTRGRRTSSRSAWRRRARTSTASSATSSGGSRVKARSRPGDARRARSRQHAGDARAATSGTGGSTQPAAQDRVRRRRLRGRELLPARGLHRGLFLVTQELLGIRYEPAPDAPNGTTTCRRSTSTTPDGDRAVRALLHGPLPAAEQVRPRGRVHAARRPPPARWHVPAAGQRHRRQLHQADRRTRRRCCATARS